MAAVQEERCLVPGPAGAIEVRFTPAPPGEGAVQGMCAVVCHPHPLHGGTMDNKVVTTLVRAYRELGMAVARFNFRGVGASEGSHDHGIGEVDDLAAVVDWALSRSGAGRVALAGFSFGTGVASNLALVDGRVAHLVVAAPPVGRYNFAPVSSYPCPVCVVMGDRDELVDAASVYRWAEGLDPAPDLVPMAEATHFFHGQLVAMREALVAVLRRRLGQS